MKTEKLKVLMSGATEGLAEETEKVVRAPKLSFVAASMQYEW